MGIWAQKLTTAALLDVYNRAMEIDRGNEVCAVFDLRKAFDSVPHRKLVLICVLIEVKLIHMKYEFWSTSERVMHAGGEIKLSV